MSDQLTTERLREIKETSQSFGWATQDESKAMAAELLAKREECEAVGRHRDQLLELARLDNETAREAVLSGRENKFRFGAMTTRDAIAEVVQQRDAARTEAEKLRAELEQWPRQIAAALCTTVIDDRSPATDVCKALGADVDSAVPQALMFKEKACEAEKLRAELDAVKRQRDELVQAVRPVLDKIEPKPSPFQPLLQALVTALQAASQPAQQPKPADGDKCEGGHDAIGIAFTADDVWLCKECLDGCDVEPKP